jgi:hypothetical protein
MMVKGQKIKKLHADIRKAGKAHGSMAAASRQAGFKANHFHSVLYGGVDKAMQEKTYAKLRSRVDQLLQAPKGKQGKKGKRRSPSSDPLAGLDDPLAVLSDQLGLDLQQNRSFGVTVGLTHYAVDLTDDLKVPVTIDVSGVGVTVAPGMSDE